MHLRLSTCACLLFFAYSAAVRGQQPRSNADEEDPLGPPTRHGIRMTPGMARALGQVFTKNVLVQHYEMDAARSDQAAELVARRLMSAAHAVDTHGAALSEVMITRLLEAQARRPEGMQGSDIFTPDFQKEMAEQILPALPAVRDLMGGVVRDTMPLLPFKQQLKMTAELAAAGTALNGFEQNMQRWARGEGQPGEDPFNNSPSGPDATKKDTTGQSPVLKGARDAAQAELDKQEWLRRMWQNYLNEFKKFYALDDSQAATADSILREYLERARGLMQDASWRDQIYRSRLWLRMAPPLRMAQVFSNILNSRYDESMAPINALGDEFRLRLEEIPTEAQKAAANERIAAALKERGYDTAVSSQQPATPPSSIQEVR